MEEKFLFECSHKQLERIERILNKKKIPHLLVVWGGMFRQHGNLPKYLVHYECCEVKGCEWWIYCPHATAWKNYFGTMHYFTFAEDGCSGCLNIEEKPLKLPNVKDIFKFKEL